MHRVIALSVLTALVLSACAPAAPPSPTAAPPKPAPTAAPAKAAEAPAAKPAEKPAEAKAAASPATKAAASPAASPAAKPAEAKPTAVPAKVDTKAVEDFYRGKTVKMLVGFAPGGGFDQYARLVGRFMGKHVPGAPSIVVENMDGAGSRLAANNVYNVASKDGTVIGVIQGRLLAQQLLGGEGIEFEAVRFQYLGAPSADNTVCVVTRQSGFASIQEALGPNAKELILGGDAPGTGTHDAPLMLREVLKARIKLVPGYSGTAPLRVAAEKGEVDGLCTSWESLRTSIAEQVQKGDWKVITRVNERQIADLPVVGSALDLAPNDEARQLLRFGIVAPNEFSRPFVLAPGVPQERVQALRNAFSAALKDPELLAAAQQSKQEISPVSGDDLQKLITEFGNLPADLKAKLKAVLQTRA